MRLDVHIHHHDRDLNECLSRIINMQEILMSALDDLKAEVERNTSLEQSAVTLIQGIAQQLKDALAANDPVALQDLTTKLSSSADALAAAITANTPAPPPVKPPTEETPT